MSTVNYAELLIQDRQPAALDEVHRRRATPKLPQMHNSVIP